jgi:hypothetical protein
MLSFGGGCPWASTTCTFDHGEPAVSILESVPYWLRFTYVTPVLITKLRMGTARQESTLARSCATSEGTAASTRSQLSPQTAP